MTKFNALLLIAILISSIFLIQARYRYRVITSEIFLYKQETNKLKEEGEKLNYEYNSYAKPARVLNWATENNMVEPKVENTIFVE